MNRKVIFTDGIKSFALDEYRPEAWTWLSGGPEDGEDAVVKDYYRLVPWLFRAVGMRANAVAKLPWEIQTTSGDVFDSSENYENKLGWLPNPIRFLWLTEASQTLTGRSYWFNIRQGSSKQTTRLKYLMPTSVTPWNDKDTNALLGFIRNETKYKIENNDILYFWMNDPWVEEIQPPNSYPAKAALHAAGAKFNIDEFVAAYFKRGAVRPTIMTIAGSPPKDERERIDRWWNKLMTGIGNAFKWRVFNADSVDVKTLGDGLDALNDNELSADVRYDIAAALEIPQTKLFSSDAAGLGGGGVATKDDLTFYNDTVVPEFERIAYDFTRQLLEPLGLKLVEKHERLDIYQTDESERADSLINITTALDANPKAALAAAQLLGMELPPEVEKAINEMIAEKQRAREQMTQLSNGNEEADKQPPEEQTSQLRPVTQKTASEIDLDKWKRKALKRLERNGSGACGFDSEHIPAALVGAIEGALDSAFTVDAIKAVFDSIWIGYP